MSSITTIQASDLITNSRTDINTNFSNLNGDKIETSTLDTDNTLSANSDSKIATQKAVKAYVDAGGNVNASTTTKGIVEEATAAEVAAGTASGGTGARLFVNPSTLTGLVPVGSIIKNSLASPGAAYINADGTAVSRTTYSALFAAIGTTYGTGNGSTTFNLPLSVSSFGGFTYDTSNTKTQGAATSISMSHTISRANSIAFFGISVGTASPSITSVQYGGVAMVQIGSNIGGNSSNQWYYIVNPAIGTANFTASWTGSASANAISASYYGMGAGMYSAYTTTTTAVSTTTLTETTTAPAPSLNVAIFFSSNTSSTTPTLDANATARATQVSAGSNNVVIGDLLTTNLSTTATFPSSTIYGAIISIKPVSGSTVAYDVIKT